MAATRIDALMIQVTQLLKEVALEQQHGLDIEEAAILAELQDGLGALHEDYLDRMIECVARHHPNPDQAVNAALGSEGVDEMKEAQERVRTKLVAAGIPLGATKKDQLH